METPHLPGGRIAVVANDALGNFAVACPVVQGLKIQHQGAQVTLVTGPRVRELARSFRHAHDVMEVWGRDPRSVLQDAARQAPFDLVVNLENTAAAKAITAALSGPESLVVGPSLGADLRGDLPFESGWRGDLWQDREWIHADLTRRYPELSKPFIGELFFRLAYLSGDLPLADLPRAEPPAEIPPVLLATAASLPEKLWPAEKWVALAKALVRRGKRVGLLGAPPKVQNQFWHGGDAEATLISEGGVEDWRGRLTLPEVVGALGRADLVVSLDNGLMHFAAAQGVPVIGLFRNGIHRLWAPPVANVRVIEPGPHHPVAEIAVETVLDTLQEFQISLV